MNFIERRCDFHATYKGTQKALHIDNASNGVPQLAPLLLSRLVLLDDTAVERFLPDLLTCYSNGPGNNSSGIREAIQQQFGNKHQFLWPLLVC